ncbi:hypothetical protein L228DRAFT_264553 [Xylona heveae TC161]|uniref:Pal1-domain-containing protein n=1 Tax=Xylona heveae (strain CBS 132557 / TC161) TaxID=1328760 RepID=A0A165JEB5_XYLHT|nr:hypothetical protein L228DRAFT_264553 [Xylona heveae TC161]KZF26127.1 hypothetical protein L228DRAFT_264553 [Xylona heveae TC161]
METQDKHWASKYLFDPLLAPEPSAETGPGVHHVAAANSVPSPPRPSRKMDGTSVQVTNVADNDRGPYPSPPTSASPRKHRTPPSYDAVQRPAPPAGYDGGKAHRRSVEQPGPHTHTSTAGRRRGSSLTSRFPGDQTHHPLDMLKRENKLAHRAPHLQKRHIPGPDTVDSLDTIGGAYHHGGPYDATLLARNTSFTNSPLEAVARSNQEAIKATPPEKLQDSLERHRPLDGVALTPPGMVDTLGHRYDYEEGTNMMIENGGNYKRWPGVEYLPEDLKGKGEPSYSIEKALKEHKSHRKLLGTDEPGIEMAARPHSSGGPQSAGTSGRYSGTNDLDGDIQRRNSTGRRVSDGLKRRLGSLRRKPRE